MELMAGLTGIIGLLSLLIPLFLMVAFFVCLCIGIGKLGKIERNTKSMANHISRLLDFDIESRFVKNGVQKQ